MVGSQIRFTFHRIDNHTFCLERRRRTKFHLCRETSTTQTYDTGIGNLLHDFFGRKLTFFDQCLATVNGFFPFVAFYINKDSRFCITARIDYCINLRHFSTDRRVNCCRNEAGRFGNLRAYLHHITFCYYWFGRCANVLPQQNNCLCRNFRCDDRLMCRQFIFVFNIQFCILFCYYSVTFGASAATVFGASSAFGLRGGKFSSIIVFCGQTSTHLRHDLHLFGSM